MSLEAMAARFARDSPLDASLFSGVLFSNRDRTHPFYAEAIKRPQLLAQAAAAARAWGACSDGQGWPYQKRPARRLVSISNSGATCVPSADAAEAAGLTLSALRRVQTTACRSAARLCYARQSHRYKHSHFVESADVRADAGAYCAVRRGRQR